MHGDFTWIDLSTFDVAKAKTFYRSVFQWDFTGDESGYVNCSAGNAPTAGLYDMPEPFRKIRMPSFWMTYISVEDIDSVVKKASELGGEVELEETNPEGKVALIRDPAGAGFTCYEGSARSSQRSNHDHGRWSWSELFVSDLSKVDTFYTGLFGWSLLADDRTADRHVIQNKQGKRIGAIQVADNSTKGEKEFWAVAFAVNDSKRALAEIVEAGGKVVFEHSNSAGKHHFAEDSQGASFVISGKSVNSSSRNEETSDMETTKGTNLKWRSLVGLIAVYLAIFLEADWIWGALFLFWVIPDLKSGTTYFIEPLQRRRNPALYWAIVLTWLWLSAYLLISPIWPG